MIKRFIILFLISLLFGLLSLYSGFNVQQASIVSVFLMSILGTLFFWHFRISFVFIGVGLLFLIHAIDMESFLKYSSLDVILFLVGMMILVAMMKEAGFFTWLITMILRVQNLTGPKFLFIIMAVSFLLSGITGEVSSIMIIVTVILEITYFLDVNPVPLIISSILATNIGSAATVMGNPIGILIAIRGDLTFEDFITYAMPISIVVLIFSSLVILFIYRKYLAEVTEKIKENGNEPAFRYLISVPADRKTKISIAVFAVTVLLISLHRRFEILLNLDENALLIMIPIISSGFIMIYRHDKAQQYIEKEVEWNSLLFFMFLFAMAGVVQASGLADVFIKKSISLTNNHPRLLLGVILISSSILSSVLDNVVVVASYVPIIKSLEVYYKNLEYLWWALLFGACYGGNITVIGSTANIIALGLLEKRANIKIGLRVWLKAGILVGLISIALAYLILILEF